MLFQEMLSRRETAVRPIGETLRAQNPILAFERQWEIIAKDIDYVPIFKVAREILSRLPSSPGTLNALNRLAITARNISASRAALRHDLMGRIFHKLLADAKYFGAFYTKIPSATLLLKLAMEESDWNIDWKNPEEVARLRIIDLACGTGTLLKAALGGVVDRHVEECVAAGVEPDPGPIHQAMIESGVWGFDVLPSASHLAATAIAMHDPSVKARGMRLYVLPLGGQRLRLGSMDFASGRRMHVQRTLMGASIGAERATSASDDIKSVDLPRFDLVVMNPPFTRSVYGNLLFGALGQEERGDLRERLQKVVREKGLAANITAGFGPVFLQSRNK